MYDISTWWPANFDFSFNEINHWSIDYSILGFYKVTIDPYTDCVHHINDCLLAEVSNDTCLKNDILENKWRGDQFTLGMTETVQGHVHCIFIIGKRLKTCIMDANLLSIKQLMDCVHLWSPLVQFWTPRWYLQ